MWLAKTPIWCGFENSGFRRGADKSLTVQEGITPQLIFTRFIQHNPQGSKIHFLDRCSTFCNSLEKIQNVVRPTRSPRQQLPPRWKKNCDLSIVFSVQGTGGSPTGSDLENRVGDQDIGSPGRPVSSALQVPREPGNFRARKRQRCWNFCCVYPSKYP